MPEPRDFKRSERNPVRKVEMHDPQLSDNTNRLVTEEVREVIGADTVHIPSDRPHPAEGDRPLSSGPVLNLTNNRLLIRSGIATGVIVGVIVALTTGKWWLLPLAVIVLGAATASIVTMVLRMTATREHASPITVAALEADGVRSPDELFSAVVAEFTEDENEPASEDRSVPVEQDAPGAAAEQQSATTPTGGRSRVVGP